MNNKRIFKMFVIFMAAIMFCGVNTYAQDQKVSIDVRNVSLEKLFDEIERQTPYRFSFRSTVMEGQEPVTLAMKGASVKTVLDAAFAGRNLKYEVVSSKMIAVSEKSQKSGENQVTGTVKDESGEPVPGAFVKVVGTDDGVLTDNGGNFNIGCPSSASLEVSFIGYQTQVVAVNGKSDLRIVMKEDFDVLQEVVVVGYGTVKRADMIGAVASVDEKVTKGRAFLTVGEALSGQMAGVSSTTQDGQPGKSSTVRIRGIGSFNNNEPLYVIDGMPISENGADIINAADIESISVLKDAASASIYGSRAGNGVILITTKKGADKAPVVTFETKLGINQASKKLSLLNAKEFTTVSDETLTNSGYEPYWKGSTGRADTDWQNEIFQNGFVQNYTLGVRGGAKSVRYYLGGGYDNQNGTLYKTGFERYSAKANVDVDITKRLTIGMNMNYTRRISNDIELGINSVLMNAVRMPATVPAYNADGTLGYPIGSEGDGQNPIGYAERSNAKSITDRILTGAYLEYKFIPELVFRSTISADINNYQYSHFSPTYEEGSAKNQKSSLSESYSWTKTITWENTLNFNKTFGVHELSAVLGHSVIQSDYKYNGASKANFISNDPRMRYFNGGTTEDKVTGGREDWALLSLFGRVNYTILGRYMLQANVRGDASSRFGANNRWGIFPSFAAGWRISEEEWMKGADWLSNLKLRASWGMLGTMPDAKYGFTTSLSKTEYVMGENQSVIYGYAPTGKANADFKWETSSQTDVGLDLGFFDGRLNISGDYYYKYTKDILQTLPNPDYTGMSGMLTNIGEMKNTGFEFTGSWNDTAGDFSYSIGLNLTTQKNEVTKLFNDNSAVSSGYSRTEVGHSIGEFYGYVYDGIFQNQAEIDAHKAQPNAQPGDFRFKDLNGDGQLSAADMTFIGTPLPKVYYGANLNFAYKGIDLGILLTGVGGNDIYYSGLTYLINGGNNFNKSTEILTRWQKEGDITDVPRLSITSANNNFRTSSRFVQNGSYLRISNLQLGYSFQGNWMNQLHLSKLRVFVSVSNLYTFTSYSGYDPAVDISSIFSPANDQITYPVPRTILGGLTISF